MRIDTIRRSAKAAHSRNSPSQENLTVRRILQVIELAFIVPDIVKAIVRGEQPSGLTVKWLGQNPLPSEWQAQRRVVAAL